MKKPLIIVESPTKARTIKKFLPARYAVKASVGHVRDLPKSTLGVDVENDFAPRYLTIKGKGEIIKELRGAVKSASEVYLATDPDREGEAIAWHLAELLKLPDPKRIELHEITKEAALAALKTPHHIDLNRVNAQQARRILDRLVGYKISPLLWAKVRGGLSAGRVQSVAVKLIVDREREIAAFVPKEYWSVTALLAGESDPAMPFSADLVSHRGEKFELHTQAETETVLQALEGAAYRIAGIKKREVRRQAPAPFTTSTLQQEASRKLRMRVRRAMQVAQSLYEGLDLGGSDGTVGLITYMRTDSTRISDSARDSAREFIVSEYGEAFHGGRVHRVREGAQDAHEAIRPTSIHRTPGSLAHVLKRDDLRLYTMIWERFVASQMSAAVFDQTIVDVSANEYGFRATGTVMRFAGFTRVYEEGKDEESSGKGRVRLPELHEGETLDCRKLEPKQHFTEPPPRYSEAALVKALEDNGIGRPFDVLDDRRNDPSPGLRDAARAALHADGDRHGRERSARRSFPEDPQPQVHRSDGGRSRQSRRGARGLGRAFAPLLRSFRDRAAGGRETAAALRAARRTDRRDLPELRPADGHQDRTLRALHLVHRVPRMQDGKADRQRDRRRVSEVRRRDRRASLEERAHVLRLRDLSEVRFHIVGRRGFAALPGLQLLRRLENAARRGYSARMRGRPAA